MDNLVKPEKVIRHSPPNEFDMLPVNTIMEVHLALNTVEYWKQTSEDSNKPCWKLNGWETEI
jgi:hypothetical protein